MPPANQVRQAPLRESGYGTNVRSLVSLPGGTLYVLCIFSLIFIISKMTLAKSVEKLKSASLTDLIQSDEIEKCHNFSIGNPHKKEFYSPNYGEKTEYYKNLRCTFRITADPGHVVAVDFRDKFELEDSPTCEYDKLEVRDGAYGYSTRLGGPYCGNTFPKRLVSSKRYMWLQFISDDSIEYGGFRAVYEYLPVTQGQRESDQECQFFRGGPSGIIQKSELDNDFERYQQDDTIDCMWTIEADAGKLIYLNFNKYTLSRPNDCDFNFIQIFKDRMSDKETMTFCGTTAEPQKSISNVTSIRLFMHKEAFAKTNFTLHYTAIREIAKEEKCDPKAEFSCGDQTCVDIRLKCDGEFDCKYRYDEEPSICHKALGASVVLTSEHMIIILVVFFALVIAMCASISISCYNKVKDRQLREREYKERRSKEASVEATIDRSVRGQSSPERILEKSVPPQQMSHRFRDADEESSDGCYVPEVDLSVFKHPNGGETIPKKSRAPSIQQQQQYPYISESFESLESDVIVPPAPPPVPPHMKERRDPSPPPPSYRIVGGKVVANPSKNEPERMSRESTLDSKGSGSYGRWPSQDSRPGSTKPLQTGYNRPSEKMDSSIRTLDKEPTAPMDSKASFLRGPLEAGAPRSVYSRSPPDAAGWKTDVLPKFGSAKVTPDGPRGPLAGKTPTNDKGVPLATFRRPYDPAPYPGGYRPGATARNHPIRTETDTMKPGLEVSDKDSSRAHSVASSTLSAPDVIGKR